MPSKRFKEDPVNHPSHYTYSQYEVIDIIEAWHLGYHDGNALKYIARHRHKDNAVEDLKKARWYIDRLIAQYEAGPDCGPLFDSEEE